MSKIRNDASKVTKDDVIVVFEELYDRIAAVINPENVILFNKKEMIDNLLKYQIDIKPETEEGGIFYSYVLQSNNNIYSLRHELIHFIRYFIRAKLGVNNNVSFYDRAFEEIFDNFILNYLYQVEKGYCSRDDASFSRFLGNLLGERKIINWYFDRDFSKLFVSLNRYLNKGEILILTMDIVNYYDIYVDASKTKKKHLESPTLGELNSYVATIFLLIAKMAISGVKNEEPKDNFSFLNDNLIIDYGLNSANSNYINLAAFVTKAFKLIYGEKVFDFSNSNNYKNQFIYINPINEIVTTLCRIYTNCIRVDYYKTHDLKNCPVDIIEMLIYDTKKLVNCLVCEYYENDKCTEEEIFKSFVTENITKIEDLINLTPDLVTYFLSICDEVKAEVMTYQ